MSHDFCTDAIEYILEDQWILYILIRADPQSRESTVFSDGRIPSEAQDHCITNTTTPDTPDHISQQLNIPIRCFYSMARVEPVHALILAALLAVNFWAVPTVASEDGSDTLLEDGSDGLYSVQEASRHGRVKRQTRTVLTGPQQQMVVDALNDIRGSVGSTNENPTASDMEQLVSINM